MTVSKNQSQPTCKLTKNGKGINQVDKFNSLGSFLTSNGKSDYEIKRRIALGKEAIGLNKSKHQLINEKEKF